MRLLQCFIASITLHASFFFLYPISKNSNVFVPENGIVNIDFFSIPSIPNNIANVGEKRSLNQKNKKNPPGFQNIGKEGNTKQIEKANIKVIYPEKSIQLGEEGVVLLEVKKEGDKKAKITLLKASPYNRLNEAAITAIEKALLNMERDNVSQKIQIGFRLERKIE